MRKFWKKWCERIERHNNSLTYVNAEEACGPGIIFVPIITTGITLIPFICTQRLLEGFLTAAVVLVLSSFFVYQNTKC